MSTHADAVQALHSYSNASLLSDTKKVHSNAMIKFYVQLSKLYYVQQLVASAQ